MFKSLVIHFYRELKNDVLKIVTNPFVLSFVVASVIIITLPPIFNKYKIETIKRTKLLFHQMYYYADLNNDGISERIEFRPLEGNFFSVTVSENSKVLDQWNFVGKMLLTPKLTVSSVRNDSLKSIWFFVYDNNKIYLNCLNPFENKFITRHKFVADFLHVHGQFGFSIWPATFFDSNKDGIKEFYFYSGVGYSMQPRKVYKYDPVKDSVYRSALSYAALSDHVVIDTTSNKINFTFATSALGNSKVGDPYSDRFSWLMCYNSELSLKYKPIKIGYYTSKSDIVPLSVNGHKYFVAMNIYEGKGKHLCSLRLYNSELKLIREKKFPFSADWFDSGLYSKNKLANYFYIIKTNGTVEKVNADFKIVHAIHFSPLIDTDPMREDIDNDHRVELIFQNRDLSKLIIARSDFSHYVSIDCAGMGPISHWSLKLNGNKPSELVVSSDNEELTLLYGLNYIYYLRYPIYAGIYITVLFVILLIEKAQKHRAELKYETERSIAELQLKSIKNQLDPHFTLNILNSIGGLFYKQDREKADYVFGKYSKLLRSMVLNSDKIVTTLSDELEYVQNYLELEQFRNGNSFSWKMDLPEHVNGDIKIPKMLVHTFVENAIKHGLRHRDENGELYIGIINHSDNYNITVRDNGIGRRKAKQIEFKNTGKGLGILDQILDLYYNLMKTRITYHIKDMTDANGKSSGTEVRIKIPVN